MKKEQDSIFITSTKDFFTEQVEEACHSRKVKTLPAARDYLVVLLEHYMHTQNLTKKDTLAEMFLKANSIDESINRVEMLKQLGDTSLYISGFFGDSLNRKVVDIDYYASMGGAAFGALATIAADENNVPVFEEFAHRFMDFVDVLTYISQKTLIQTDQDLLRLYDRYVSTGSELAKEQLMEKGLLNLPTQNSKNNKQ